MQAISFDVATTSILEISFDSKGYGIKDPMLYLRPRFDSLNLANTDTELTQLTVRRLMYKKYADKQAKSRELSVMPQTLNNLFQV